MKLATSPNVGWTEPARTTPPRTPLFSLRRMTALTTVLLIMVAFSAAYGIYHVERHDRFEDQLVAWCTCGMLVCLSISMLLIGRYGMQRSLGHVEEQLRTLTREDRLDSVTGAIPEELKSVMGALNTYLDGVRGRVERLRLQKKELDIQMRQAEAERRHTEAIIFSISDAVLVVDNYGELVLANAGAEDLFNFKLADWRHRPVERIIADRSVLAMIKDARTAGAGARRQIEYSTTRSGRTQTFNITLSTVVDSDGQVRGVVAVLHDITRERESVQIKTDFVSAVSHELRTPLSSIKAYTEMLLDGEAPDEEARRDFYRIIDSETERLQRLISKILEISRIESGVLDLHRTMIQPNELVSEVLEALAPQAREKEITLEKQLGENLPCIHVDRDLLHQAVQNLVTNGIKYTRSGGRVCVATGVDDETGHYTIAVSDNGMGIRAEDLPRVFDKFYRSAEGKAAAKGTGLGLNLVKKIVETVHGGDIAVASEHGVGTTIVLRFPMSK